MKRILIIHQSPEEMEELRSTLERAGFQVATAECSETGLKRLYQTRPHTIIMDNGSYDRQKLCSEIRDISNIPIVILGNGNEVERALMLELGADFYMREVIANELIARVNSLIRRYQGSNSTNPRLDPETNMVELGGQAFNLTATEFRLFSCLVFNEGRVVPYPQLIAGVWGGDVSYGTLHLYIRRLRQRLGIESVGPYRLLHYRGEGYCFSEDEATLTDNSEGYTYQFSSDIEPKRQATMPCWPG